MGSGVDRAEWSVFTTQQRQAGEGAQRTARAAVFLLAHIYREPVIRIYVPGISGGICSGVYLCLPEVVVLRRLEYVLKNNKLPIAHPQESG